MKYLFAGLLIPAAQFLFMLAFTLFALCIGMTRLYDRFKPARRASSQRRLP